MKGTSFFLGCVLAVAAALAVWSAPAQAYTFGFEDVAYVSSDPLSNVFPNYVGPPNFSSSGYYQVLSTDPNTTNWSNLNSTNPKPVYVFKSGLNEFIQNDPKFPTVPPLQGTENEDKLSLGSGWTTAAAGHNGQFVHYVTASDTPNATFQFFGFNNNAPNNQPVAFTFNSFDLQGTAGQTVTFTDGTHRLIYISRW